MPANPHEFFRLSLPRNPFAQNRGWVISKIKTSANPANLNPVNGLQFTKDIAGTVKP